MADRLAPLSVDRVRPRMRPEELEFESTEELEPLGGLLGQARAEEAMRFGAGVQRKGFNLYVLGPPGMGKHRLVREVIDARAKQGAVPSDWVYVHRFDDPDRPQALALPAGRGAELSRGMEHLVVDLGDAIRAAFETDEYRNRRRVIEQRVEGRHEEAFAKLAELAEEKGLRLLRTPMGFAFAPIAGGEVIDPKKFNELAEEEQQKFRDRLGEMEEALRALMQQVPRWQREARDALRALEREMASYAVSHAMKEVRAAFSDLESVANWLERAEADIVEHAAAFVSDDGEGAEATIKKTLLRETGGLLTRYRVNLFVDRRECEGAPVVEEDHPTLDRLVGRIEQRAQLGALISDFTLIKPGALHRANGGTLILDARRLLSSPSAYDSLKRSLRRGEVEIESLGKALGLSASTLDPDPIPIDVKIVLIGERRIYYLLNALDPDFDQLFKVAADFEEEVPRDADNVLRLARLACGVVRAEGLLHFDRSAIARIVEEASRLADDQKKLSTNLTRICDLMREADWRARERSVEKVGAEDVRGAVEAQMRRNGRLRDLGLEAFDEGLLLLDTSGAVVGQINGLAVLSLGPTRFGRPSRITCRVRLGKGEVVDIEREVTLGGPLHSKGVMILSSFLAAKYASERPLSLSASLVFEQSYGGVDGDSASLGELCVLLSALADIPIEQRFAITGSVNQMGEVQPIGGANEKIEGFFDVCRQRGLDGTQGVLIPESNVQHLMLSDDVVEAIAEGKFNVYAVRRLDDALELLTGIPAGEPDADGAYPEDSVHGRVHTRLAHFAEKVKEYAESMKGEGKKVIIASPAASGDPEPPSPPEGPGDGPADGGSGSGAR